MLLLSISMSLLENYLTLSFPAIFVKEKYSWLKWVFMGILTLTSFYLDTLNYPILTMIPIFVFIIFCRLTYEKDMIIGLFYLIFIFTILFILNLFCLLIENYFIGSLDALELNSTFIYPLCILMNKLVFIMIYLYLWNNKTILKDIMIKDKQMLVFTITELTMLLLMSSFLALFIKQAINLISSIAIIFLLSMVFLLFCYQYIILIKANKKILNEEIKRASLEFNKSYYEDFQKNYDMNKALSHDMKNHFTLIYTMLQENQVESAMEYIKGVYHKIGVFKAVKTKREILNYIIDSKLFNTKDLNIKYVIDINDNLDFIDNIDLCILLGNLLDNCIEAVEKIDNRFIELIIDRKEDIVFISLRNTFDKNSLKCTDGEIMTSKDDAGNHGIGIKNVKDIINKYNGDMLIDIDDYFNIYIYFLIM